MSEVRRRTRLPIHYYRGVAPKRYPPIILFLEFFARRGVRRQIGGRFLNYMKQAGYPVTWRTPVQVINTPSNTFYLAPLDAIKPVVEFDPNPQPPMYFQPIEIRLRNYGYREFDRFESLDVYVMMGYSHAHDLILINEHSFKQEKGRNPKADFFDPVIRRHYSGDVRFKFDWDGVKPETESSGYWDQMMRIMFGTGDLFTKYTRPPTPPPNSQSIKDLFNYDFPLTPEEPKKEDNDGQESDSKSIEGPSTG